jgi:hypothetical protein
MQIHMRDIAQLPAGSGRHPFHPVARQPFIRCAAVHFTDNDAIDALGIGIQRYARFNFPPFSSAASTVPRISRSGSATSPPRFPTSNR